MIRYFLVPMLCMLALPVLAQEANATDGEDFAIYLQNVGGPATVELCAPVLPESDALGPVFADWSARNKLRAGHGRTLALTRKSESELVEYETWMVVNFREKFAGLESSRKLEMCKGFGKIFGSDTFK